MESQSYWRDWDEVDRVNRELIQRQDEAGRKERSVIRNENKV